MFNYKMSENPLEFGMVCVVVKLALCYVFQRVLFFVVHEGVAKERGFPRLANPVFTPLGGLSVYPARRIIGPTTLASGGFLPCMAMINDKNPLRLLFSAHKKAALRQLWLWNTNPRN